MFAIGGIHVWQQTQHRRAQSIVVWIAFVTMASYMYYIVTYRDYTSAVSTQREFVEGTHDRLLSGMLLKNNVDTHETPNNLNFILKHRDFMSVMNDLEAIQTYDNGGFSTTIAVLDRFLRYYELILSDRKPCTYFDHMTDLRRELLNQLHFLMLNVPTRHVPMVQRCLRRLQAKTRTCLKIISHKCFPELSLNEPPYGHDPRSNEHEVF
jgi:hypothetical protein